MAKAENCPNCGAEVIFRSPALPARICDYCQATVKRIGDHLEQLGEVAALPFDVSPVRIGTMGEYEGNRFEVIGRIRLGWEAGAWNDWLCLFNDMSHGWLSESDGVFSMVVEQPLASVRSELIEAIIAERRVEIGQRTQIDKRTYVVTEARWAQCISAEGELPFAAATGWRVFNVDLSNPDGFIANLELEEDEDPQFYTGRYVELAELNPKYLRSIHGWKMPDYAA